MRRHRVPAPVRQAARGAVPPTGDGRPGRRPTGAGRPARTAGRPHPLRGRGVRMSTQLAAVPAAGLGHLPAHVVAAGTAHDRPTYVYDLATLRARCAEV